MNRRSFFKRVFGTVGALVVAPFALFAGKKKYKLGEPGETVTVEWKERLTELERHYRKTFKIDPHRLRFENMKVMFFSVQKNDWIEIPFQCTSYTVFENWDKGHEISVKFEGNMYPGASDG